MRKIRLGALALACVAGLSLAACNNSSESTPVATTPVGSTAYPVIDVKPVNKNSEFSLQRMMIDTSSTKLDYYLGDTIDLSGLKVQCTYVRYEPTYETEVRDVKDFYYDVSNIDMTALGDKVIDIFYRDGIYVAQDQITIHVRSSFLETSGVEYASGLECDVLVKEFLLDSTFEAPVINKLIVHSFTGTKETSKKDIKLRNCTTECVYKKGDKLDTVGDYMYKISYTETLTIDGKSVDNTVTTYIVIRVKNDVTSIKFKSGTVNIPASAVGIDFSDWKIDVTREVGGTTEESYQPDTFVVRGINSILEGEYEAYIEHIESGKGTTVSVKVEESTTQNIVLLDKMVETRDPKADENGIINLDENKIFFVKNAIKLEEKVASFGALEFDTRITIKGNSLFGIKMSAPGTIVVYIASSGDEIREVNFLNSELDTLNTFYTAGQKQVIKEYIVNVTEAGTYYFSVPASGYVHGAIIATNK